MLKRNKNPMPKVSISIEYEDCVESEGVWWCVLNGKIDGDTDGSFAAGRGRSRKAAAADAARRMYFLAENLEGYAKNQPELLI